ncbi:MAG: OmpA family protein [Cyclobacteriaceae bacterium]
MKKQFYCLIAFLFFDLTGNSSFAQLDTEHYIPPVYARVGDSTACGNHYLTLSTEEKQSFQVEIYEGCIFIDSVTISRDRSYTYFLGNSYAAIGVVKQKQLNTPLIREGLFVKAKHPFYAVINHKTINQAGSFAAKGSLALGRSFRAGFLLTADSKNNCSICSNFISFMATEDHTTVTIKGIKKRNIRAPGEKGSNDIKILLNKGESYVIAVHSDDLYEEMNLLMGLYVVANKPIALNSGSWLAKASDTLNNYDIGIDQLVPVNNLGKEYVVIKGEGVNEMERVVVVATQNDTKVIVNNNLSFNLKSGEYHIMEGDQFSKSKNLFISASKPIYVFQNLAGAKGTMTAGFNLIPPLNECPHATTVSLSEMNVIADSASVKIISSVGSKFQLYDSQTGELLLQRLVNESNVIGTEKWCTYSFLLPKAIQGIRLFSTGTVNVGVCYHSNNLGAATFVSGFAKGIVLSAKYPINEYDPIRLSAIYAGGFSVFEWYKDNTLLKTTKEAYLDVSNSGEYYVVAKKTDFSCEISSNTLPIKHIVYIVDPLFPPQETNEKAVPVSVLFQFKKHQLRESGKVKLDMFFNSLINYEQVKLTFTGHADCQGKEKANVRLSKKRAQEVKKYLVKLGVPSKNCKILFKGSSDPVTSCVCNSCSEEEHAKNRRVEVNIFK